MKRKIFVTLIFASLCCVLLSGCFYRNMSNIISCGNYENAESYSVGNFKYSPSGIKKVEINWVTGKVNITESQSEVLTVSENEDIPIDEKLRYLIEGDTLKIQFWKSGYKAFSKNKNEAVAIEIPKGVELVVTAVSSPVIMKEHELTSLKIGTVSGEIFADSITANMVDITSISGEIDVSKVKASNIEIDSTSGNIALNADGFHNIRISAVSSSVKLNINQVGSTIEYETVSGSYFAEDNKKVFGDGLAHISVETVSGNLRITK